MQDYEIFNKISDILFRAADQDRALTDKECHHYDVLFFELVKDRCGIEKARQVYNIKD